MSFAAHPISTPRRRRSDQNPFVAALVLFLILLSTFTFAAPADAQRSPTHLLEARGSLGGMSIREDDLVPYAFTGPSATLGARYQVQRGVHIVDASFLASMGLLFTNEGELGAAAVHELSARYLRVVVEKEGRVTAVGPNARYAHELAYLEEWDDAHGYWLASLLAGIAARHREALFARADLELTFDLGLIGMRARPPLRRLNKQDALNHADFHFNRLKAGTEFAWLLSTFVTRGEAMIRLRREGRPRGAGFAIGYETRFSWANDPKPFADWYNGVAIAYAWSWP